MRKFHAKLPHWSRSNLKFIFMLLAVVLLCVSQGHSILAKYHSWLDGSLQNRSLPAATADNFSRFGSYHQISIPPQKTDRYLAADYRLWLPGEAGKIRGLIVKQHGCGDDAAATGLDHANDLQWQALAAKHRFALLGTKLPTGNQPCEYWALINYGSVTAFLNALHILAEKSQRPELEAIPWVLWGHSGGADWVAQMLQEYADRVIAMVAVRGGGFTFLGTNPALVEIPVLFAPGAQDPYASETVSLPKIVFERYRKINAPWGIAIEPNAAHEAGNSRFLAIPYLDAVITQRLAKSGSQLDHINRAAGWLGNPTTYAIAPAKQYPSDPAQAVWLPDEEVARKWQAYLSKGEISPTRQPDPPTEVIASRYSGTEVRLTWQYSPDSENGLPAFRIYRNRSLIATVSGQSHNFGDAPEPANVVLEYVDQNGQDHSTYTVAAFNSLGESASRSVSYSAQSVNDNPVNDK